MRLCRAGARVLVLEARSRLGGRATAFPDRDTGEIVDNGQHVLLGCYHDTFEFLRAIGAEANVQIQPSLSVSMIEPNGRPTRLVCPPLPSPFHLLAGVMDWDALGWGDRLAILRMIRPLRLAIRELSPGARTIAASPGETVESWLIRNGQTDRLRELLWNPLALAALNQPPTRAAAPPFARVLAEMFGSDARAAAIALPVKPLHLMYAEPARAFLEAQASSVRTGAAARIRVDGSRVGHVEADGERWRPAAVICAVPWFALADTLDGASSSGLAATVDSAKRTEACPIVTVNLWFDKQVIDEPFVGLPGRAMQWVFDKRIVFGEQASHLSLVSSGALPFVNLTNDDLIGRAYNELLEAIPAVRAAGLLRATVVREPRATFSLAPGQPRRPDVVTDVERLFLAGDWIGTGLPATIESAVRSGHRAADAALRLLDR